MMRPLGGLLVGVALLGLMPLSAMTQDKKDEKDKAKAAAMPAPSFKHLDGRTLVFVANAEDGSTNLSDNLSELRSEHRLPFTMQVVAWSRQNGCYPDMADSDSQLRAAHRLACFIAALRKDAPNANVILIGHSAGARVVLAAAEMAGEKSVDRIIVLHAAVSTNYDLHNALKASRCGIDAFSASADGCLEHAEEGGWLADGAPGRAAGRVGFRVPGDPKEAALYANLRQCCWTDNYAGNGGHCAWILRHNMKRTIVPILASPCCPVVEIRKMAPAK